MADPRITLDAGGLSTAFTRFRLALEVAGAKLRWLGQQIIVARDAELALRAFVADGGDVKSILDIERALGVTHE